MVKRISQADIATANAAAQDATAFDAMSLGKKVGFVTGVTMVAGAGGYGAFRAVSAIIDNGQAVGETVSEIAKGLRGIDGATIKAGAIAAAPYVAGVAVAGALAYGCKKGFDYAIERKIAKAQAEVAPAAAPAAAEAVAA